jgi:hypothetical protein
MALFRDFKRIEGCAPEELTQAIFNYEQYPRSFRTAQELIGFLFLTLGEFGLKSKLFSEIELDFDSANEDSLRIKVNSHFLSDSLEIELGSKDRRLIEITAFAFSSRRDFVYYDRGQRIVRQQLEL